MAVAREEAAIRALLPDERLLEVAARELAHLGPTIADTIVVVPGARAGRHLLRQLAKLAPHRATIAPRIVTTGALPELLYTPTATLATPPEAATVFAEALRELAPSPRGVLFRSGEKPAFDEALVLALRAISVHAELALHRKSFVDAAKATFASPTDVARFTAFATARSGYLARLASAGLGDRDEERKRALTEGRVRSASLLLVGVVDGPPLVRALVAAADANRRVIAYDARRSSCLDRGGMLDVKSRAKVRIDDERVRFGDGPFEQAEAVATVLAELGDRIAESDVTIAIADDEVRPLVVDRLARAGVDVHGASSLRAQATAPGRALTALFAYADDKTSALAAALGRHADIEAALARTLRSPVTTIANERATTLGAKLRPDGPAARALDHLLAPIAGDAGRDVAAWGRAARALLRSIYADVAIDAATTRALTTIDVAIGTLEESTVTLAIDRKSASVLIAAALDEDVPTADGEAGIAIIGWLDALLDDAKKLLVVGVNESRIPAKPRVDGLLPEGLRRALGLAGDDERLARDAYALAMLAESDRLVAVVAGRRSADDDPLLPSRLLLDGDVRTAGKRLERFFERTPRTTSTVTGASPANVFVRPRPKPLLAAITSLRVTAFRDYLACPYRFYLRHVLGLERGRDGTLELDAGEFGTLLHGVMEDFGRSDARDAESAEVIATYVHERLDARSHARFGDAPPVTIAVQIEQLHGRLDAFARAQAAWAEQGWRIRHVELAAPAGGAPFDVDGVAIGLRGRIDRVDENVRTGAFALLDYKTGESAKTPEETHRIRPRGEAPEWVDLQLPLYRHVARAAGIRGPSHLGYILVPGDPARFGFALGNFDDAALDEADEVARAVVRAVRAEVFWPPADDPPAFTEDFSDICGDDGPDESEDEEP